MGSTLDCKFLTMPAPVANYCVEQGRVYIGGGHCAIATPLGRKSLAMQPNPALKVPQHLTKPFFS